jgi:predicted esterase
MADQHNIPVTRTARFFTLGKLDEQTKRVWFVLHGYGQLAEYFIRKFEVLDDGTTFIVAPEALSRFYVNGDFKRVGASWMTREARESEIDDYVAYLESVRKSIFQDNSPEDVQITILGFSQGAATACRWLNRGHIRCHRLIFWGGYFANGIHDLIAPDRLPLQNTHFVYGTRDEFLNRLDVPEYLEKLRAELPSLHIVAYDGGHSVEPEVLKERFGG